MVRLTSEEAWKFWRDDLGDPKYILAPMVNASELQFRILCKRYGVDVAYTPMLHSRLVSESKEYKQKTHPSICGDLPKHFSSEVGAKEEVYELPKTIAQVCGSDPATVVRGCKEIQDSVMAIDLNCGCPQGIAKRGNYGSFLLEKPDVILTVIEAMVDQLKVPVTVKIRIVDDIPLAEPLKLEGAETSLPAGAFASKNEELIDQCPKTLALIHGLEKLGVAAICLHGRTSKNKGHEIRGAEWGVIKEIVKRTSIPIIANGSIGSKADADECLKYTGAAAVMSAIGLLGDPAIFCSAPRPKPSSLMMELCYIYENLKVNGKVYSGPLKGHVFHALHHILQEHTDVRDRLNDAHSIEDIWKVCELAQGHDCSLPPSVMASYYYRHIRKNSNALKELRPAAAEPPSKKLRLLSHAEKENSDGDDNNSKTTATSEAGASLE